MQSKWSMLFQWDITSCKKGQRGVTYSERHHSWCPVTAAVWWSQAVCSNKQQRWKTTAERRMNSHCREWFPQNHKDSKDRAQPNTQSRANNSMERCQGQQHCFEQASHSTSFSSTTVSKARDCHITCYRETNTLAALRQTYILQVSMNGRASINFVGF